MGSDFASWQRLRTHDPRRLILGSRGWGASEDGCAPLGLVERVEIGAMLAEAHDAGLRMIDTARGDGGHEENVGRLASPEQGWRIITRLAPDVEAPGIGLGEILERVTASLEASSRALRRDELPVLLLHHFAQRHACGGRVWRLLLAERDAGRIGALGVAAATPEEAWAALDDPDVAVLEVATSLLDLRLYRQGFFERAHELGRRIFVRDVDLRGVARLAPERLPRALRGLEQGARAIHGTAGELGVPVWALVLAFVRGLPGVHPVVGCDSRSQLGELLNEWANEGIGWAPLQELVDGLPVHEASLVDPAQWPRRTPIGESTPRRPGPSGIATLPA